MDISDPELKGLISHLNKMKYFRVDQTKRHELLDILVIAVCAAITGVTTWTGVEEFGNARIDWFKTFLNLKHGIPSHDTFRRIFMLLDKDEFNQMFSNWRQEVVKGFDIEQICIDGKALRRSFERGKKSSFLHMVNAWSTGASLCLGQLECVNKKDEINTIPNLLDVIDPKDCIVSVDALGCQKNIAKKIISRGGDYLLQVKGNQPSLEQKTKELFDSLSFTPKSTTCFKAEDDKHGRIETRKCTVMAKKPGECLGEDVFNEWPSLHTLIRIESERVNKVTGKTSQEKPRHFISSHRDLSGEKALSHTWEQKLIVSGNC